MLVLSYYKLVVTSVNHKVFHKSRLCAQVIVGNTVMHHSILYFDVSYEMKLL